MKKFILALLFLFPNILNAAPPYSAIVLNQGIDMMGAVFYVASSTCPLGSIPADGTAVSRSTYGYLFSRIGTTFGTGDGSTTFNVPNLKGVFVRGTGSQTISSITYSGTLGAVQGDQFQGHWHNGLETDTGGTNTTYFGPGNASTSNRSTTAAVTSPVTDGTNGTPRTGTETRPANIGLTACISVASQPMPLIIGSVSSNSSGAERIERACFGTGNCTTACSATPCSFISQSGSWISSVTRNSAGNYTVNIVSGMFSAAPDCTITNKLGNRRFIAANATSATAVNIFSDDSAGAANDSAFTIQCMGPR